MLKKKSILSAMLIISVILSLCSTAWGQTPVSGEPFTNEPISSEPVANDPASNDSEEEFRGVWIASVANTNWPSKKGLTAEEQKNEFIHLMDEVEAMNLNAAIVQIRPVADAFYPSKLNPWSEYLSGKQGEDPGYDPLAFMIDEAHKRGIEFHAWFNPFRVSTTLGDKEWDELSVMKTHPEWVEKYGGMLWLNPGIPEVREYAIESVMEVVRGYDIDAVHFDDYFYPYPVGKAEFPDKAEHKAYQGEITDIGDWRRENINSFIKGMHEAIKGENPDVKFGVSPIGVWRSKTVDENGSDTTAKGSYDTIYADTAKWVKEGWMDYVAPQIYWDFSFEAAPYPKVLAFWTKLAEENPNVHLYIGHGVYRVGAKGAWSDPEEIPRQLALNKESGMVKGVIFYNINSLLKNPLSIRDYLTETLYTQVASIPGMPWLDAMLEGAAQAEGA
jgi:uncharacterized lipoprotein YddW (UPF0748 family)